MNNEENYKQETYLLHWLKRDLPGISQTILAVAQIKRNRNLLLVRIFCGGAWIVSTEFWINMMTVYC